MFGSESPTKWLLRKHVKGEIFLLKKAVTTLCKTVVRKSTNAKIYRLLNNRKTTGLIKNCLKALFVIMP